VTAFPIRFVQTLLSSRQVRTAFNILGPMLNPARAAYGLVGVYSKDVGPLMAAALQRLGLQKALVVHSFGLDELTPLGPSDVIEVRVQIMEIAQKRKKTKGKQKHKNVALLTAAALQRLGLQKVLVVHSFGLDELAPLGPSNVIEVGYFNKHFHKRTAAKRTQKQIPHDKTRTEATHGGGAAATGAAQCTGRAQLRAGRANAARASDISKVSATHVHEAASCCRGKAVTAGTRWCTASAHSLMRHRPDRQTCWR